MLCCVGVASNLSNARLLIEKRKQLQSDRNVPVCHFLDYLRLSDPCVACGLGDVKDSVVRARLPGGDHMAHICAGCGTCCKVMRGHSHDSLVGFRLWWWMTMVGKLFG